MTPVISAIIIIALIIADQLVKLWAINSLMPVGTINFIDGFLKFTYVENYGAAFGIFHGKKWLLLILVGVILTFAAWFLLSGKLKNNLEKLSVTLIIAGGFGNFIDRIRLGYVVDYIDINELFSYPMFNLADCFVVIGACLLIIAVLLDERKPKTDNAESLPLKQNKTQENDTDANQNASEEKGIAKDEATNEKE